MTVEASHTDLMFFLPSFDLCILFTPPPEITFFILSFGLYLLFAPPPELMLFLFSIFVVVLSINDKHTLPVKYANMLCSEKSLRKITEATCQVLETSALRFLGGFGSSRT
jgi:hypothetical protein